MEAKETLSWIKTAHDAAQFITEIYTEKLQEAGALLKTQLQTHLLDSGHVTASLEIAARKGDMKIQKTFYPGSTIDTAGIIIELEEFCSKIANN